MINSANMKLIILLSICSFFFIGCSSKPLTVVKIEKECMEQQIFPIKIDGKIDVYKNDVGYLNEIKNLFIDTINSYKKQVLENNEFCKKGVE